MTMVLLQPKDTEQNKQRGKRHEAKPRGYKALDSKSPLSVKSHRHALIPVSTGVTIHVKCFLLEMLA